MARRVCVVTGTRAEYGLLYWLIRELDGDPEILLQLVVTGSHLSPEFGLTVRQIEADGFVVDDKVEMLLSSDTAIGVAKSMGLATISFAESFARLRPDIVVLLGDRFEMLAVAQVALISKIPIAHIHGGELTEGALDDAIRHSITKMSSLHFASTEVYRRRVIQMGEHPDRVYNVGAIGLDNIRKLKLLSKNELEESLGFSLSSTSFLVTFHPATADGLSPVASLRSLLASLGEFPEARVIFTKSNADAGGREINEVIDRFAAENKSRVYVTASLGQLRYLSALKHVSLVIGNSSSGIVEAPALRKPTVNIGSRQQGRLRAETVIDVGVDTDAISRGISRALSRDFQEGLTEALSPYGSGGASSAIRRVLRQQPLEGLIKKKFYDVSFLVEEGECDRNYEPS